MTTNWPVIRLGDVLRLRIDAVPVDASTSYPLAGVYSFGRGLIRRQPLEGSNTTYKTLNRLHEDDFVVSQLKAWEGALTRIPADFDGWFLSPQFPTFRPVESRLDVRYLDWFFKHPYTWEQLRGQSRGMGARRDSVSPQAFLNFQIPLPPLPEQRRIVSQIDELASRITEANRLRDTALAESDLLLAALLRRVEKDLMPRFARTLGEAVISVKNGISRRPDGLEEGPIVLRLADLAGGEVNLSSPRRGSLSIPEVADYDLVAGDLLFLRVNGSRSLVGRCVPFRGATESLCFNDHLIRVRVDPKVVDWRFVAFLSNGPSARVHFEAKAITTAGQLTVNHPIISAMPLPIPPLTKQEDLVRELERLKELQAELNRSQAQTGTELTALMPAVLRKALAGEL